MSRSPSCKGGQLARAPGLAALRRPGRGRARRSWRTSRSASTSAGTWCSGCGASDRTSLHRAARPRAERTAPCRSCSRFSASPTRDPGSPPACARMDKVADQAPDARAPSCRRPTSSLSTRRPSGSSAPPTRWRRSKSASASRSWSSRRARAPRWASSSRASPRRGPGGAGRSLQLRRPGAARALRRGRELAVGRSTTTARQALPVVEAMPQRGGLLRLRGPLRDRAHRLRLPRRPAADEDARRSRSSRSRPTRLLGLLRASPAST